MELTAHQPAGGEKTCLWCGSPLSSGQHSYCSSGCQDRFLTWLEEEHASARGIRPQFWNIIRRSVLERDRHRCQICGSRENLSVHHIIPLSDGGDSRSVNLQVLCHACHQHKHGRKGERTKEKRFRIRIRHQPLYVPAILACEWFSSSGNR